MPPKVPRPWPAPIVESPTIARLERELAAGDTDRVLAAFWQVPAARTPLIEATEPGADSAHEDALTASEDDAESSAKAPAGSALGPDATYADTEVVVTFLWRDAHAERVLLFANRVTDETRLDESLMRKVAGTDVWHLSYRMRADWRASYVFLPQLPGQLPAWRTADDQVAIRAALDQGHTDPTNPDVNYNRAGVAQSVVALPDAPAQPWLAERVDVSRGPVMRTATPDGRTVWVHCPVGGRNLDAILVVFDGDVWTSTQSLPTTLDNLYHDRMIPGLCTVLVDAGERADRWREHASGKIDDYVTNVLLPWVRHTFAVAEVPAVVVGQSLGGLSALRLAVTRPDVVHAALVQSASLWFDDLGATLSTSSLSQTRVHLQVGAHEWVLTGDHRRLAKRLRATGAVVDHVTYNGGHDDAWWRGALADGLCSLLPRLVR